MARAATVRFRCGHETKLVPNGCAPTCPVCRERRVARVDAPAPRIKGVAHGPLVAHAALGGVPVELADRPLALRQPEE